MFCDDRIGEKYRSSDLKISGNQHFVSGWTYRRTNWLMQTKCFVYRAQSKNYFFPNFKSLGHTNERTDISLSRVSCDNLVVLLTYIPNFEYSSQTVLELFLLNYRQIDRQMFRNVFFVISRPEFVWKNSYRLLCFPHIG